MQVTDTTPDKLVSLPEDRLRAILEGTAATTGDSFFRSTVRHFAQALEVKYALIARCTDSSRRRVRNLAFWMGDHYRPNLEYGVAGTPCEEVMDNRAVYHSDDVQARFPADTDLVELGVRSYLAVPIHDPAGNVVGHFAALDTAPMRVEPDGWVLRVFSGRDGAEFERLQAEERLRKSEAQARHLLESNFDGVVLVTDGQIAYANRAVWQLAGCQSAEDMLGASPADFIVPEQRQEVREQMANALTGHGAMDAREYLGVKLDGSTMPVEVLGRRIDYRGAPAILAAVRDITLRKRQDRTLAEAERLRSVGQLAAGVAHNFNNALTAISGYAELLTLRLADHEDAREDLGQIQRVAAQAANLTSQLVAFSRSVELKPRTLSLNDLVREVCDLFGPLVSQRIQVRTQLDRSLPPIRCDAAQMEQVIINLLLNARDAMPAGGDLTLETNNVLLSEAFLREHPPLEPGPHVRLTVKDTGMGIDRETLDRIFEPFFTTKDLGEGVGLGLAMAHGAVKQSGGCITAESEPGKGSVFALYFPASDES